MASTCSKSTFALPGASQRRKIVKGVKVYTQPEALNRHRDATAATTKPLIYPAAGVSKPELSRIWNSQPKWC